MVMNSNTPDTSPSFPSATVTPRRIGTPPHMDSVVATQPVEEKTSILGEARWNKREKVFWITPPPKDRSKRHPETPDTVKDEMKIENFLATGGTVDLNASYSLSFKPMNEVFAGAEMLMDLESPSPSPRRERRSVTMDSGLDACKTVTIATSPWVREDSSSTTDKLAGETPTLGSE